jgi:hypothetical protein
MTGGRLTSKCNETRIDRISPQEGTFFNLHKEYWPDIRRELINK